MSKSKSTTGHGGEGRPGPASAEKIQAWMVEHLAAALDLAADGIDPKTSFDANGVDSLIMEGLMGDLEEWLGLQLPDRLLDSGVAIEVCARRVAELCAHEG